MKTTLSGCTRTAYFELECLKQSTTLRMYDKLNISLRVFIFTPNLIANSKSNLIEEKKPRQTYNL